MKAKKKVTTIINSDELPETMRKFAQATSQIKAIESEIELARQEIVRRHENKLAKLNEVREEAIITLQAFAEHHRDDLFVEKKSMELAHGTIGFRMGTPKVDKNKKYTWENIIEAIKDIDKSYIKTQESVNKELIIAERKNTELMAKFSKIGIEVIQDESFFVEAKEENLVAA